MVDAKRLPVNIYASAKDMAKRIIDRHQIVPADARAGGPAAESFLPEPQMKAQFDMAPVDTICTLFPAIKAETGRGYGLAAQPQLRGCETRFLRRWNGPQRRAA